METETAMSEDDRLGAKPIRDLVEDLRGGVICLAAALMRSGALKPEALHEEVKAVLDGISASADLKAQFCPLMTQLAQLSVPKPDEQAPPPSAQN